MSSLSEEQRKRIEENRARALAKLAEKNKSSVAINNAKTVSTNNSCSSKHQPQSSLHQVNFRGQTKHTGTFYNNNKHGKKQQTRDGNTFSAFQYQNKNRSIASNQPSCSYTGNKTKTFNDVLGKKSVVNGTCVLIDKTRFKVVIGFHAGLIGIFKTLSSRSYDAQTRTWSFALEEHEGLIQLCKSLAEEVILSGVPSGVLRMFLNKKQNPEDDIISNSKINWELIDEKLVEGLMPFQREGIIFSIKHNGRILLADDMGLGKTIQAIAVACYYRKRWPLLIVVPSSLRMTWRRALIRWLPSLKPDLINVVLTGKDEPNAGLVNIISYDLLVKRVSSIKSHDYQVIIADECHLIKNLKAERTKAILPLLKTSSHAILISGTPALSRPAELYTQISAINPRLFPSYHHFGLRYCAAIKNNFGWDYSGSSNMEELQLVLEDNVMIRRLKKVVLDQLPSKTREIVLLDPSLIKDKALSKTEKELLKSSSQKDKRSALLEYFTETCSVKAVAVREYIIDLVEGGHKIIVFAHHHEMLDVICESLRKKKFDYIRIDGKTPSEKRQHLCDQFQRDWETRVAVLSVTAANTGITLTEATSVVFAELFWNPGALVQAEDRAYRIGQKNAVVIHYLIAKKTADDYLWPLIQKKLDVLSEAGLNKENFSMLEKKTFQDPKQRNLKDLFESLVECSDEDILAECNLLESTTTSEDKTERLKSGEKRENSDSTGASSSEVSSTNKLENSDDITQHNYEKDEWFGDNWDELDIDDNVEEPNAKRKRLKK